MKKIEFLLAMNDIKTAKQLLKTSMKQFPEPSRIMILNEIILAKIYRSTPFEEHLRNIMRNESRINQISCYLTLIKNIMNKKQLFEEILEIKAPWEGLPVEFEVITRVN